MLIFSRGTRCVWTLLLLGALSGCTAVNQSFEALKDLTNLGDDVVEANQVADVTPTPVKEGFAFDQPRPVAINQFKLSKQALTNQQQTLVSNVYDVTSSQRQGNSVTQLKPRLDAIEAHISSNASLHIPSMLFLALGDGYLALQQIENAMSAWQQSIRLNEHNYFAHDRLAQAFRQQGDFGAAEQHYNEAIGAWPDFISGYRNRGILYDLYMGDKSRALNDYQHYKQLLTLAGDPTREVDRWIKEMQRATNL